jgi:integrase
MTLLQSYLKEIESTLAPKTVADYSARLEKFAGWAGERPQFNRQTALGYLTYIRDIQTGKASVAAHKVALSAFYTWLVENDHLTRNPVRDLAIGRYRSKPKADDAAFTPEEYARIKEVCRGLKPYQSYWLGAVIIGWNTGLRMGDIACLERDEVDMEGERLRIMPNKTKRFDKILEIPMSDEVWAYLTCLAKWDGDRLFRNMCEQYATDGAKSLSKQFERICAKAGVKGKSFHCLRHALTSRLMNSGAPIAVVSSITGNTMQVLQRYSHVSHDLRVKALEAVV